MKRLIILAFIAAALAASVAQADVCIEQPPGEVVCVPESPVNPAQAHVVYLPIISR